MKLTSWDEANAMVDGWGLSGPMEPYCKACTLVEVAQYAETYRGELTAETLVDDFLGSAHRGGFVPAVVDGVVCVECGVVISA